MTQKFIVWQLESFPLDCFTNRFKIIDEKFKLFQHYIFLIFDLNIPRIRFTFYIIRIIIFSKQYIVPHGTFNFIT